MSPTPLPLAALLLGVAFTWPGAAPAQTAAHNRQIQASRTAQPAVAPARVRALAAPPSSSLQAQFIDDYDLATGVLTIPLVLVDTVFYRDVRTTLQRIDSIGRASGPSGVFDRYEPEPNRLTVPVARAGGQAYYNAVVTPGTVLGHGGTVASVSVPTDLAAVRYPDSYRTPTTSAEQINLDPCRLDLSHVSFPATWLGPRPLPAIQGAPLKPEWLRGMNLKDIGLQPGNPAFILTGSPGAPDGCSGDLPTALERTMRRLKQLGSDYVSVTQWRWATNRADGSWTFTRADDTFGALSDAGMRSLVQIARAAGLKVLVRNQIQGYFDQADPNRRFVPPLNADNLGKFFNAYQAYIAEQAPVYQALGIDIWELGCGTCMYFDAAYGDASLDPIYARAYKQALDTMRQHFTGQVLMGTPGWLLDDTALASRIDIFQTGIWFNAPADLEANLSVARLKGLTQAAGVQAGIDLFDRFGKRILLVVNAQSRANYFSQPGYMEETVCTSGFNELDPSRDACIQRTTEPDFGLQAIVHQAYFEFIASLKTTRSTLGVEVWDYWQTDSLMPFTAFPNIATSIRNKPAEGVVKAWFAR